jgi:hypothetical protein
MPAAENRRRVHCLGGNATTDDHGVPLSWYPDDSIGNVPRVKAPSCPVPGARRARVRGEDERAGA